MNDVSVHITDCSEGVFDGLLGNANGIKNDDYRGINDVAGLNAPRGGGILGVGTRELEQQRLAFLANSLGDAYRVTQFTSLFDYGMGQSTLTFTDRSFPKVHRTKPTPTRTTPTCTTPIKITPSLPKKGGGK